AVEDLRSSPSELPGRPRKMVESAAIRRSLVVGSPGLTASDSGPTNGHDLEVEMTDKIRVGIVGATVTPGGSGWGANAHVPALKALADYELTAVCTAHEDTAAASKEAFGAKLAFHNFDDMLGHADVDLIVVAVRVPGH